MSAPRAWRFAAAADGGPNDGGARRFLELAHRAELLGYDTFVVPDHLGNQVGPIAALAAVAVTTERIRLGTSMLANGFRHPAVLAKELATIDVLSKGRLEVGLGAGMNTSGMNTVGDFTAAGIEFDKPGVRVEKLHEAVQILDSLLRGKDTHFRGKHYQVEGVRGTPRPRQGPRPPFCIGAGGPRMLRLAAEHADIISVIPTTTHQGKGLVSDLTLGAVTEKVELIRTAAKGRFDSIELSCAVTAVMITDDREKTAEMALTALGNGLHPNLEVDVQLSVGDLLASPYVAIGTYSEIAEQLEEVRRRTMMSYIGVFPGQMDAFAPVIPLLKAG